MITPTDLARSSIPARAPWVREVQESSLSRRLLCVISLCSRLSDACWKIDSFRINLDSASDGVLIVYLCCAKSGFVDAELFPQHMSPIILPMLVVRSRAKQREHGYEAETVSFD